jgi:aryl-alcohol dehydrogenase-like predicted oxidoreductase
VDFSDISEKMVLGTAQFVIDYGIANLSGKPSEKEVFKILDLVWENGVRSFDTAPSYSSEVILGEFISTNGLQNEVKVLTKIPSLTNQQDFEKAIKTSIKSSLEKLGCPIEVLFFHNPEDSGLLLRNQLFFEYLLNEFPVSTLGVSVYVPQEVDELLDSPFELAFQFPFNVLDRRFEKVNMPHVNRYARSIFLQGLLASPNGLRADAPTELLNLQNKYHEKLDSRDIDPVDLAISFVANNNVVDYFLVGVDSTEQIQRIFDFELFEQKDKDFYDGLLEDKDEKWCDPRSWGHRL